MIAYLEGRLAETWGNACLIVTQGGVGYEVALPAHTLAALPGRGEHLTLYTSLAVREDVLGADFKIRGADSRFQEDSPSFRS